VRVRAAGVAARQHPVGSPPEPGPDQADLDGEQRAGDGGAYRRRGRQAARDHRGDHGGGEGRLDHP
jgi:hypothetical protein